LLRVRGGDGVGDSFLWRRVACRVYFLSR